jgi:tyrosine-protein phosphatase
MASSTMSNSSQQHVTSRSGSITNTILRRKRSASQNPSPTFAQSLHSPKKQEFSPEESPLKAAVVSPPDPSRTTSLATSRHSRRTSLDKQSSRRPQHKTSHSYLRSSTTANMQSPTHSTFANSTTLPSFMSVYGSSIPNAHEQSPDLQNPTSDSENCFSPIEGPTFNPFHQTRNSTSTSASDSADSSPTTTASIDSSSITDPSPGPSPQSPASMNFAMDASRFMALDETPKKDSLIMPVEKPGAMSLKNRRNLKNLGINTSAAYNLGRPIATAPLKTQDNGPERTSAPASPAFVKPPTPPKRKLGKMSLTIQTGGEGKTVPPTPGMAKPATLRHFQSSPSLPLYTAGVGPVGGMKLPKLRAQPQPRSFAEIPMEDEEDEEQNFDVPLSREEKPKAYPDGPIRIYESGVDLFQEPSADIASRYDVIINVASEIRNPFEVEDENRKKALQAPSSNFGVISPDSTGSPTTPKATPISADGTSNPTFGIMSISRRRPEYIHMPWEHNTDIVPDLWNLVRLIDNRVDSGKRVLVHCQLGVSRSASLILAYGIYKNQHLSVQEVYEMAKKRSKWIGPNMSLIMQLQEFKSNLSKGTHGPRKAATMPLSGMLTDESMSAYPLPGYDFESKSPSEPATPRTAPFNPDGIGSPDVVGSSGPFSAGPVEGSGFWDRAFRRSWGSGSSQRNGSLVQEAAYVDPKGHVVPVTQILTKEITPVEEPIIKPIERTQTAFKQPAYTNDLPFRRDWGSNSETNTSMAIDKDTEMMDAPPVPQVAGLGVGMDTLMSPRSQEFHMTPLLPREDVASADTYNVMSPTSSGFPASVTGAQPSSFHPPSSVNIGHAITQLKPQREMQNLGSIMDSPPRPKRHAPPPPLGFAKAPAPMMEVLQPKPTSNEAPDAIFSPTSTTFSTTFPTISPRENTGGFDFDFGFGTSRPSQRIDSLVPQMSPGSKPLTPTQSSHTRTESSSPSFLLAPPPGSSRKSPSKKLRTKLSAPNLTQCRELEKLQSEISKTLPGRPAEAEEALMSPRVENFVHNPFHAQFGGAVNGGPVVSNGEEEAAQSEDTLMGVDGDEAVPLPGKTDGSDPRSPPQFGISPITRNIFGVL